MAKLSNPGVGTDVDSNEIQDGTISTADIADGAVTRVKTTGVNSDPLTQVVTHSTTIGDYASPSSALATSEGDSIGLSEFGTNDDQEIEDFTTYTDDADAANHWIPTDSADAAVIASTDTLTFAFDQDGAEATIYKVLSSALSDSKFVLRGIINFSTLTAGTSNKFFLWLSSTNDGASTANSQDCLGWSYKHRATSTGGVVHVNANSAESTSESGWETFTLSTGTDYYFEVKRTSTTSATLTIWTGSYEGTTVVTDTQTISSSITGLDTILVDQSSASSTGEHAGTIKEIRVYDGVDTVTNGAIDNNVHDDNTGSVWQSDAEANPAIYVDMGSAVEMFGVAIYLHSKTTETEIKIRCDSDTVFADANNVRTITVSNLTAGSWNYIRFNRPATAMQYLQIYGSSGSSVVLAIAEIKVLTKTESEANREHGFLPISNSDTSIGLDGE